MANGNIEGIPLSPIQEQFWLQYQSDPDSSAYNMASIFEITGSFDEDVARKSLEVIVRRHDILRTVFVAFENNGPKQYVMEDLPVILEEKTYSHKSMKRDIEFPFDIEAGPLFRFVLYRKGKQYLLLFVFHHLVIDLRSKDIFGGEFSEIYNNLKKKKTDDLPDKPQYESYITWYSEFQKSESYEKMRKFWDNEPLISKPLAIVTDKERPPIPRTVGTRLSGDLSVSLYNGLHRFCDKEGTNPFLVLLSAYYLLLFKYSGQKEISIGVPRTNRFDEKMNDALGCFVNILPMSIHFSDGMSFLELLGQVRKKMLFIHRNQYLPYMQVINSAKGVLDRKYNPLFQVGFTNEHPMELTLEGLTVEPMSVPGHGSQLDLFLYFWQRNGIFHWELEYNTDLFAEERIRVFIASYRTLLMQISQGRDFLLDRTEWLSDDWLNRICYDWNRKEECEDGDDAFIPVHRLFEIQTANDPQKTALIFQDRTLSYSELNGRANHLAGLLIEKGICREHIVGISLERSFEMVVGLLAILKAGASYLPLEPTHPVEYIRNLIEETNLKIILSQRQYSISLEEISSQVEIICINDFYGKDINKCVNPFISVNGDNRAYVFYTSGSTGKPKGVEVEHQGLTDRIKWMDKTFGFGKDRKTLLKTPYNFDVSGMEFWLPLTTGAPLVIAEPDGHLDNHYLSDVIKKNDISIVHFVPSLLKTFLKTYDPESCKSIRDVLCCGEALPLSVVNEFYEKFPYAKLHNLYGPTEATIFITYWECVKNHNVVPIGKPVTGTQVYILDENLKPVPPGVTGDLYLSGSGLARGYYGRPDLTESVFLPHIIYEKRKMYKSGDLAQWSINGEVLYLGRKDGQVQLHGQRIELGEIEAVLNNHDAVDSSAVIVEAEFGSEQRLIAYVVRNNDSVSKNDLKEHLQKSCPKYMVPSLFLFIKELPLSQNGKIDRKRLPRPDSVMQSTDEICLDLIGETEKMIGSIWKNLLNLNVGRDHSFFDLGGTSLQLMEVQTELSRSLERTIPVTDLFRFTTVKELASHLDGNSCSVYFKDITERVARQKRSNRKRVKVNRI